MGEYSAISDVGNTLVALLLDKMALVDGDDVALVSPGELTGRNDPRLTLFLYRIDENGHLKNERQPVTDDARRGAPLVLDLHYLLTAHPLTRNDSTAVTADQHSVLGEAMRVFHDNGTISGSSLNGSLAGGNEIHLSIVDESLDQLTSIWSTFENKPFRVSVAYVVGPVEIESNEVTQVHRVVEKEQRLGQSQEEAPDE